MDDLLTSTSDAPAALLEGPDVGPTNGSTSAVLGRDDRVRGRPQGVRAGRRRAPARPFVIDKGEFVFVVGPSGSGKSTIIRLLLKELEPTERTDPRRRARPRPASSGRRSRCCAATSAASSRTSSSSATGRRSRTSRTRCGSRASRRRRSGGRCRRCSRSSASRTSPGLARTSSRAGSSSASRSRAPSSTTQRS